MCLAHGCASPPAAPVVAAPPAPAPPAPCEGDTLAQAQVALKAGRLERARWLQREAARLCPASVEARRALLSTLVTLGHQQEASELAEQIARDPASPEDERVQARRLVSSMTPIDDRQAVAWVDEGMAALDRGDPASGQWLLDRALVALERSHPRAYLDLPNGPRGALPWRLPTRSPLSRRTRTPLAASDDGRLLAYADGPEIRVLSVASGREAHALRLPGASALALAFAPDAPLLAALGSDRVVSVWNLSTGKGRRHEPRVAAQSVALGRGGRLTVGGDEGVEQWTLSTGRSVVTEGALRGLDAEGNALVERAGRLHLASAPEATASGGSGHPGAPGSGAAGSARSEARSTWTTGAGASALLGPGARWVAVAGKAGGVELMAPRGGATRTLTARQAGPYRLVSASRDGARLLAAAEGAALLWDTASGQVEVREGFRPVAFVGDDALLEADGRWSLWRPGQPGVRDLHERPGSSPREVFAVGPLLLSPGGLESTFKLWDTHRAQVQRSLDTLHAEALMAPAVRPTDGALAGVDPDGAVRLIWPERQEQARLPTAGDVTQAVSFVGGTLAAFAEGKLRLFGADDGRLTGLFERPLVGKQMGSFGGGHFLATLATHGWLQLFDVATGHGLKTLEGSRLQKTLAVALSPEARWVAAGERGGEVRVWDTAEGGEPRQVLTDHQASVRALAFLGDGRLCSGDEAGEVRCRSLPAGEALRLQPSTPLGEVMSLAPLHDGTLLVVSQSLLGVKARVFETEQGRQLRSLGELLSIDGDGVAVHGGVLLAPSTLTGSTLLLRLQDGAPLGALRVLRDGRGAYFLAPSGQIELLGTSLRGLGSCRVGHRSFPSELCLDRFDTPGLLRQTLAGG